MHQFNIQFDHPLIDATYRFARRCEDGVMEPLGEAVLNKRTDDSSNLDTQSESETAEANHRLKLEQTFDAMAKQLAQMQSERKNLRAEIVKRFDVLAGHIAAFIFRGDSELAETRLRDSLTLALETLDPQTEILVNVHPSQLVLIRESLEQMPQADYLKVTPDDQIGIGDCLIEQNGQGLYASLDDQLAKATTQLDETFRREGQNS